MKTYVIGDIHGMSCKLEKLLDAIPFDPQVDRLAFLGDYIDRGPNAKGVLERILSMREEGIETICLMGNHEQMWRDYEEDKEVAPFLVNGGVETLQCYVEPPSGRIAVPSSHRRFLQSLLPYCELDDFILVHAGLRPGVPLEKQMEDDLYWIRLPFIRSRYDFGKRVIFGHTPFTRPYMDPFKIGIDTGAVYGNRLSCVCLPEIKFYSVS